MLRTPKSCSGLASRETLATWEMQDLLFTTKGRLLELSWSNGTSRAKQPGAAALWDCHARVGGAQGTNLNPAECPAITSGTNPNCQGASMMMHVTPKASGYFENMWLWAADHMIECVARSHTYPQPLETNPASQTN